MRDYTKLTVWQKSHELVLETYRAVARFPKNETYGLAAQMRRAASSIPSNIAEGAGRRTPGDYRKFLDIASGSASELEYQSASQLPSAIYPKKRRKSLRRQPEKSRRCSALSATGSELMANG